MSGETRGLLRDQPPRFHGSMSRTGEAGSRDTQIPPPPSHQKHGTGKLRDRLTRRVLRRTALSLIPLMLACVALVFTARHAANVASRAPTRRLSESHVGGHRTRQRVHLGANLGEASPDSGVAALAGIPDRVTSDLTWARRFALAAELLKVPPAFDLDTLGGQDPNTSQDLAKLRAWTRAHYEPSWTKRHFLVPVKVGGASLEYAPVFKAANNNIRYTLRQWEPMVMGETELNALSGGDKDGAVAAMGLRRRHQNQPELEDNETPLIDDGRPCLFTFVRDPLTRFVSAYSEFEYRQSPTFLEGVKDVCPQGDWVDSAFDVSSYAYDELEDGVLGKKNMKKNTASAKVGHRHSHKDSEEEEEEEGVSSGDMNVAENQGLFARLNGRSTDWPPKRGSEQRARLALVLLAQLRWVETGNTGEMPNVTATDPLGVKQGLNCYVAFHHLFPQASNFLEGGVGGMSQANWVPMNFIGHLEDFDKEWKRLAKTCNVHPQHELKYRHLPSGGGHFATRGDQGPDQAMERLLSEDKDALRAFCLMFLDDYTWGGYDLPKTCAEDSRIRALIEI